MSDADASDGAAKAHLTEWQQLRLLMRVNLLAAWRKVLSIGRQSKLLTLVILTFLGGCVECSTEVFDLLLLRTTALR